MEKYKIDMHVHTQGSYDCSLDIYETAEQLRAMDYAGMVVTDHDNYNGWRKYWDDGLFYDDFVIIKGIEISSDFGHLIAIPPSVDLDIMQDLQGNSIQSILDKAKRYGFLIGLAHPYCERYGALNKHAFHNPIDERILKQVDFLECYNYGVPSDANELAVRSAKEFGLKMTAGSDSHVMDAVGNAYTEFSDIPEDNEDFVNRFHSLICGYGKNFDYFD